MNATVDALTDLEHRLTEALSDALSKAECARLEFAARLAFALEAEERIVPPKSGRPSRPNHRRAARGAVAAGGVMRITSEHLLLGVLWLAMAFFAIAAVLAWLAAG